MNLKSFFQGNLDSWASRSSFKPGSRSRKWAILAQWIFGIGTVVSCVYYWRGIQCEGDTAALMVEVHAMLDALKSGQLVGWAGKFPPLQKIPAILLTLGGMREASILRRLVFLSLVSFVGMAVVGWWSLRRGGRGAEPGQDGKAGQVDDDIHRRRRNRLAWAYVLILLAGPLPWFAQTSFSESLAAFVILLFVVACVENARGWLIFLTFFVASLAKDMSPPFLLVLGIAANLARQGPSLIPPRWRVLGTGFVVTLLFQLAWNWVRFLSATNVLYLKELSLGPKDTMTQVSFGLGVWFSPNGGLAPFWPSFFVVLLIGIWYGVKNASSSRIDRPLQIHRLLPLLAIGLVLAVMTVGLSHWCAPLGWVCWGPRLILIWIPASLFLLFSAYEDAYGALLEPSRWGWPAVLVLALLALPQYTVLFEPQIVNRLFTPDDAFPRIAYVQQDRDYYYRVIRHLLWHKRSMLLDAYQPGWGPFFLGVAPIGLILISLRLGGWGAKPDRHEGKEEDPATEAVPPSLDGASSRQEGGSLQSPDKTP